MVAFLFLGITLIRPIALRLFGQRLGAVALSLGTGVLAYWLTASLLLAGVAAVAALLLTLLSHNKGGGSFIGGGRSRGGSGFSGGGGFSSGGGGSFGGGGASGRW